MKKAISIIIIACIATIMYVYCLSKIDIFDKTAIAYATSEDAEIANEREIERYVEMYQNSTLSIDTPTGGRWPYSIIRRSNRKSTLEEHFPSFNWIDEKYVFCKSVSNLTGRNPIDIQSSYQEYLEIEEYNAVNEEFSNSQKEFLESDVKAGLELAKQIDDSIKSSYGGCGPIAQIGIWHYFSSVLGYDSISNGDPYSSENKQKLARDVFLGVKTTELNKNNTMTFPSDYVSGFNKIAQNYNIPIKAMYRFAGLVSQKEFFMETIKSCIDMGIPITLCTGTLNKNSKGFEGHCFNICSYEKWIGTNPETNEDKEYIFYGAKPNYGNTYGIRYMSEEVLEQNYVGLIWYEMQYRNQVIPASAFAQDFVNDSGQGQYFFYEKTADIMLPNNYSFGTKRLRCSYIEDKYLVLSANRKSNTGNYNGTAYLEFCFNDNIKKIEFDAYCWGTNEGFTGRDNEKITIKCSRDGTNWETRKVLKPKDISLLKNYPSEITVLLNAGEHVRISVETTPTSENRNKGRIVLDDIRIYYH